MSEAAVSNRVVYMSEPQFELVTTDAQFPAFVGGFGSGKTEGLINRAIALKRRYTTCNVGYYMPTFDLVQQIAFPRFEEKLSDYGLPYKLNKQLKVIEIERCGKIIFRTMDSPARIIGYEVADSLLDELDTLKLEDARNVWQKVVARNRQKKPDGAKNTIAVGTTPEGFRFTYETWEKKNPDGSEMLRPGYKLIKASTYSNERNLPAGYIQTLLDLYPSNLVSAYIYGEFVNLTSGSVYAHFDRKLNASNENIKGPIEGKPGEFLHIGMDFNVGKMSAVVFVLRDENPHAVAELTGILDTPAMILAIKLRFPNHSVAVYPDASGASRKSNNASVSDISLLESAGFVVLAYDSNPLVKNRVLAMNVLIAKRSFRVNAEQCPIFAEALEKQSFDKKGEPDKTSGFDHVNDAGGYFIAYRFPVVRPSSQRVALTGV